MKMTVDEGLPTKLTDLFPSELQSALRAMAAHHRKRRSFGNVR
jgi:predicted nuclease of predicted toxin-antitoxin system